MSTRPPRFRRNLLIAAVVIALYTIAGFFIVPPVLKSQLQKRLSAELGRTVTVEKVRFNPYALSLTLEDFDIRLKEGDGSFLGWNRLYVNFGALASLTGDWVLSEIELDGFHAAPAIESDGALNFADILEKLNASAAPETPAKPGRAVRVGSLKVVQARVDFADQSRSKPFESVVGPLTFAITDFRTAGARGAPYSFAAVTESGEELVWTGTISAQPLHSKGELRLENISLAKYAPYYAELMQADITAGKLSVSGRYEVNLTEGQRLLELKGSNLRLSGLKVLERSNQATAVELASLEVTGVDADAIALKATVGTVNLAGGHLRVRREQDGGINLLAMFLPPATPAVPPGTAAGVPSPAPAAAPAKLPDIMIGEVALKDFQVDVLDQAGPRPAELGLNGIQFSIKNVTLADGAQMPLQLSLDWAPQGTVHVEGTVAIKPVIKADLKTDVTDLALLPLSPYLEQFVNARLTQGAVTVTLKAQAELPASGPVNATAEGEVKVEKFGLVDGVHHEELAGVGTLLLKGLKAATAPELSVSLDEVNIAAPYARVLVAADKSLNLASLVSSAAAPAKAPAEQATPPPETPAEPAVAPSAEPASKSAAPKITIGRVVIDGGDFSFADRSLEPNVRTAITQFAGTITGLSSENLAKADVDLKATVDGAGPVAITGQLDPLGEKKFVDLKIDFRNVDLQPLSAYSGKYAGYELARGKLALDVKFRLEGDKISSTDVITLNQFTFGSATNSPDATGLPVRLGVALLKDSEGKIVIDVPIEGSTNDPSFRIGKVVLRVIVNLLTKAATSPFSLLGSMFGGGGDELAYQEFSPGASALQPEEIKKLETMVKALTNRPALNVSLEGSYDGPADGFVLKQHKLAQAVRRAIWEQKHAVSPAIPPPGQLVITPEENAAMVKQLFDAKFPPGTEFGAPLAKAPEVAAAPPPAKKGFFGKAKDIVTLKAFKSTKKPAEATAAVESKVAVDTTAMGPSLEEMTGRLEEAMEVTEDDLRTLATARAQQVRDYFINVGKVDPERLFLAKGQTDPAKAAKGPRVFLSLQ